MRPFLITLLLFIAVYGHAQPYGFLRWSVEDGLPQSQVTALAQDERGYLWVGTNGGGLARFDGADFKPYGIRDGLADNFVRGVVTNQEGDVYVFTRRGLSVLRSDTSVFQIVPIEAPERLFQGAAAGAVEWGEAEFLEDDRLRISESDYVHTIDLSTPDATVKSERAPPSVSGPTVQLRGGNQLHGTSGRGLFLLSATGEPLRQYSEASGDLPNNSILSLLNDRQGRTWIGTSGGGLLRMIPTGLRHFTTDNGLANDQITAVHAGRGDKLWVSTAKKGVQYYENGTFSRPPVEDLTEGVKVNSIIQDGGGRVYFGTDGRGLAMLDSTRMRQFARRYDLPSPYLRQLLPAGDSSVHAISYTKGIGRVDYFPSRDSFAVTNYVMRGRLPTLEVTSAAYGPDSTFLLGTPDGRVMRYPYGSTGGVDVYGEAAGLPPGRISAIATRLETQVWVAVLGYGLYFTDLRSEPVRFYPLPRRLREVSININQLTLSPDRTSLWLGTERGLDRLFLNSDGRPDYVRRYGRAEGFLGGESTPGASAVDSLGRIWFGTLNGLVRYEEDRNDPYLSPPATFLEPINLFYNRVTAADYELRGGLPAFSAEANHFQFRYGAVDLTYADRIQYRFRLRGESPDWSPLTEERAVRYAGLSPGRYGFAVQATTDGGKTFGEAATYDFTVEAPLLRSAWFLGLVTLLLAALIVGGSYYFYRRVQRREAALREELEARNRVLGLEQKARQLQMNPHFIFNALNGIRGLVSGDEGAEARRQITRFATLMRGILNNSREEMITLADEVKVLRAYIEMERFCQNFPIAYAIHVPDGVDPEEVSLPPMLLQPFVENAILHGLAGRPDGGTVTVRFSLRGRGMQCSVEDDGIGRAAAADRRVAREGGGHRSVAVDVTRARLEAAGGSLVVGDRVGGGTLVTVVLPVEVW